MLQGLPHKGFWNGEIPERPVGREEFMRTRREFLKQGLISGAAFALSGACRFGRDTDGIVPRSGDCELVSRGSSYCPRMKPTTPRGGFSGGIPRREKRPGIIARCERPDDIARCVEFARQHDLVLAVRCGGHSLLG